MKVLTVTLSDNIMLFMSFKFVRFCAILIYVHFSLKCVIRLIKLSVQPPINQRYKV